MPRIVSTDQIIKTIAIGLIYTRTSMEILQELIFKMEQYKADGVLKKQIVMEAFQRCRPLVSNQEDFDRINAIATDIIDIIVFTANNARAFKKLYCK